MKSSITPTRNMALLHAQVTYVPSATCWTLLTLKTLLTLSTPVHLKAVTTCPREQDDNMLTRTDGHVAWNR